MRAGPIRGSGYWMEHGQHTGESIGTVLSSIASALREISEKLDTVASQVDDASTTANQTVQGRLAKLEAWAFRAGQDISGIDAKVERLASVTDSSPVHASSATEKRPAARPPGRDLADRAPAPQRRDHRESAGSRNGTRLHDTTRDSAHAAPDPSSPRQAGTTPPSEPAMTALESNLVSGRSFTASTAHDRGMRSSEPAPPLTAPIQPERRTGQRDTFTAEHESTLGPISRTAPASIGSEGGAQSAIDTPSSSDHENSDTGAPAEVHPSGLTGAHRAADEDHTPVENTHVDKLQAMLDELKRTAAAPLSHSELFGPPVGDASSKGSERPDTPRRPTDYRLPSSPPLT
ncbi:hypothetical protein [Nocardia sp. CNY236]|uniref:hypothetical protein n=1 Tax=Nocardia sp. CNY236 TaxID=1169152 RepID=UPI0018C8EAD9|nr:hypothetical protein [Nocardia sp. CNY236]